MDLASNSGSFTTDINSTVGIVVVPSPKDAKIV